MPFMLLVIDKEKTAIQNIKIFWSFKVENPSDNPNEHDGELSAAVKLATLQVRGETIFKHRNLYLGIYSTSQSNVNFNICSAFGKENKNALLDLVKEQKNDIIDSPREKKIYNPSLMLKHFVA